MNDVMLIWTFSDPLPLCHSKIAHLLTPLYQVSQKYWPPSPNLRDVIYECSLIRIESFFQ